MEEGEEMTTSLCMDDLMELKCTAIIENSIHLIPFENAFAVENHDALNESLSEEEGFKKVRRSGLGGPLATENERYACPHCDKTFSQKYIVPRHIR